MINKYYIMALPTFTAFETWSQYLHEEDFNYLIEYIENIIHDIPNNEMIILVGPPRTGKTTLIGEIATYLGNELCECSDTQLYRLIYEENIKPLIILHEVLLYNTEQFNNRNRNLTNSLINFIRYGISFIAAIDSIDTVNPKILEHSKIIMMTHTF